MKKFHHTAALKQKIAMEKHTKFHDFWKSETDSRLGVIGKYIITPEVFEYLEKDGESASKDGEIRLADAFAKMVVDGKKLHGIEMDGVRYDTGDKLGFLKATVDYALDRDDLGEEFSQFLKEKFSK